MKYFNWDNEKNEWLKKRRNVCFEDVVYHIDNGGLLDLIEHPNQRKYPGQQIFIVNMDEYAYWVPFVETEHEIFLKTIIPNRKAVKFYLRGVK